MKLIKILILLLTFLGITQNVDAAINMNISPIKYEIEANT
jgi:hypothetical protein